MTKKHYDVDSFEWTKKMMKDYILLTNETEVYDYETDTMKKYFHSCNKIAQFVGYIKIGKDYDDVRFNNLKQYLKFREVFYSIYGNCY